VTRPEVTLIVSIDTEEDNWHPTRTGITVENIGELPRLDRCFERLGVRATYFTTYCVAIVPWAVKVLREIRARGAAEIGAHLHPWNTPPLEEPLVARNTMLVNLPADLQVAKLRSLTEALAHGIGAQPIAFRAGRWGFGESTAAALLECGYTVDSSITPFTSWQDDGDGPDHSGAPLDIYRLDGRGDVRVRSASGALVEVPLTCAYTRRPMDLWARVHRVLNRPALRRLRLVGVLSRLNIVKFVALSPETDTCADMLTLSRRLIAGGVRSLHLTFHSLALMPGLGPFAPTAAAVERLYATIESYVMGLSKIATVTFATVGEAAEKFAPKRAAEPVRPRGTVPSVGVRTSQPGRDGALDSGGAYRILYVEANEDGTVGGSHQCLLDLTRRFSGGRYRPVVLFYQENRFANALRAAGIEVHTWDQVRKHEGPISASSLQLKAVGRALGAIGRRVVFLRRQRINLVHLNNDPLAGYADWLPAARVAGIPCVAHVRGDPTRSVPRSRVGRWLLTRFDRVIPASRHIAAATRRIGVGEDRIRQIYDGIDVEEWRRRVRRTPESVREELAVPQDHVLVLMVGNIRRWKGQHVLIKALEHLTADVRSRLRVVFVGGAGASDSAYYESLRASVMAASLSGCVSFLGARTDVPDLVNAADVIVHASTIPEPFGLVVLEGMALGKPVIAANAGGPTEVVTAQSGFLFDTALPDQLASILVRLVNDPDLRHSVGIAAQRRADLFDTAGTRDAVQRVYAELLESNARVRQA
jgi:glycosyltransferase involved in cell wall biosynthesis